MPLRCTPWHRSATATSASPQPVKPPGQTTALEDGGEDPSFPARAGAAATGAHGTDTVPWPPSRLRMRAGVNLSAGAGIPWRR